jgi:hypothetical protein
MRFRILQAAAVLGLVSLGACSAPESGDVGNPAPSSGGSPAGAGATAGGVAGSAGPGEPSAGSNGGGASNAGGGGESNGGSAETNAGSAALGGSPAGGAASVACSALLSKPGAVSQWVFYGADGKLEYKDLDANKNRILDYSHAGYRGGGVKLPEVETKAMLAPSGADDTAAIQTAIDAVSAMPLTAGTRGAVLLAPGTFHVKGALSIKTSGVVLRGSGSDKAGTRLELGGTPHEFLSIAGTGSWKTTGKAQSITDAYVPSGSSTLHVADGSGFKAGDSVLVERPVTQAWVHLMNMDTLVRDGAAQTWLAVGSMLRVDREIAGVNGNELTLAVPLADSYDAKYLSPPGADLVHYTFAGRISEVGVEHLRVAAPDTSVAISQAQFQLLSMDAVVDAWVKDVATENTVNSLSVGPTCKRVTIEDFDFSRTSVADGSAGYPLEITLEGTQTLVQRARVVGANVYTFATGGRVPGPNVFLNCSGSGAHNRAEPHMRWSTGLLSDNMTEDDQINYWNRGTAGSGHGWAIGWGVIWNSKAGTFTVEQPPGSQNVCIGCTGKQAASASPGLFEAVSSRVAIDSLYLAQLCERLGPSALADIGN